jgi:hypothetical protein
MKIKASGALCARTVSISRDLNLGRVMLMLAAHEQGMRASEVAGLVGFPVNITVIYLRKLATLGVVTYDAGRYFFRQGICGSVELVPYATPGTYRKDSRAAAA